MKDDKMFQEWELYEQTDKIYGTASQKGDIVLFMYRIREFNTWRVYNPIRDVQFIVGGGVANRDSGHFKKL